MKKHSLQKNQIVPSFTFKWFHSSAPTIGILPLWKIPAAAVWVLALLLPFSSPAQGWKIVNPVSEGNMLNSVSFRDEIDGFAVGNKGTLLHTSDGGENWTKLDCPTGKNLNGVEYINQNQVFAVGDSGTLIKKTGPSASWTVHNVGLNRDLTDFKLFNTGLGFICGDLGLLLRTQDGGNTWTTITTNKNKKLNAICFLDASTIIVAGNNNILMKSTDGGINWFDLTAPVAQSFLAICFINPGLGFVTGTNGTILRTTDGGVNWNQYPQTFTDDILCLAFFNDSCGFLRGNSGAALYTTDRGNTWEFCPDLSYNVLQRDLAVLNSNKVIGVGYWGGIGESTDKGLNWKFQNGGISIRIMGLWAHSNTDLSIAGFGGYIFRSTNSGRNWTQQARKMVNFLDLEFADPQRGFSVGYDGKIYRTTDGGDIWNLVYSNGFFSWFHDVGCISPARAVAVGQGGRILATADSGNTWALQPSPVFNNLYCVNFVNSQVGIAAGDGGKILRTTNGGNTWIEVHSEENATFYDISFLDANNGLAAGRQDFVSFSYILKTSDGGQTWTQLNQNVSENDIYDIQYISANVISFVDGSGGIFRSTDAGATWVVQESGRFPSGFNCLFFLDEMTGYVAGDDGVLLKTTNGGVTFVQEELPGGKGDLGLLPNFPNPFSESTQLHFVLKKPGTAQLAVYNARGVAVHSEALPFRKAGEYQIPFEGSHFPSGIYYYRISFGDKSETGKMVLMK